MRRFLAIFGLGATMIALSACTGNTGSANLVPKSLSPIPASLSPIPASLSAIPASHSVSTASLEAIPI